MSDYFDHVERGLRETVRRRRHLPWYARTLRARSRPIVAAAVVLLGGGSALAASVLRTGVSVGPQVPNIPTAYEGVVIPSSVKLLPLRVPDPDGGPPWGLRVLRTTRGLMCAIPGRVVGGRLGVLGQDGAFADDEAFHPFSSGFLDRGGCGTADAHGDAFVNEAVHGLPASALLEDPSHTSAGCYSSQPSESACPASALRDVYFGLLGPDASSITYTTPSGSSIMARTAGSDGAYLVVLPDSGRCSGATSACTGTGTLVEGPELSENETIRAVTYRDGTTCHLQTPEQLQAERARAAGRLREQIRKRLPGIYPLMYPSGHDSRGTLGRLSRRQIESVQALRRHDRPSPSGCPPVGYVPLPGTDRRPTIAQLASTVSVRAEPARSYCEHGENTLPCNGAIPKGYRRIPMGRGPREMLLVVQFTARVAVTNFDSHYEISTTNPSDPAKSQCPAGGGTFGPTQRDLHADELVRYTTFVNAECTGVTHISVDYVTVNGPSGAMPVPGLPGQSAEIPVGATNFTIP